MNTLSLVTSFFGALLTAFALENVIFTRALGLNRWVYRLENFTDNLWYGGIFIWVSFFATLGSFFVSWLVEPLSMARFLRAPGFLLVAFLVYLATYYLAPKLLPKQAERVRGILPVTTFNTALFSIFYVTFNRTSAGLYGLGDSMAYALGTGLGYAGALIILFYARKRLALCPAPRSFRGTPVMLLYMGLLSLALYGLLGYGRVG